MLLRQRRRREGRLRLGERGQEGRGEEERVNRGHYMNENWDGITIGLVGW